MRIACLAASIPVLMTGSPYAAIKAMIRSYTSCTSALRPPLTQLAACGGRRAPAQRLYPERVKLSGPQGLMAGIDDLAGRTTGERIRHFRDRAGMSRPILGGLVGKSREWVKAVESGRLQPPRRHRSQARLITDPTESKAKMIRKAAAVPGLRRSSPGDLIASHVLGDSSDWPVCKPGGGQPRRVIPNDVSGHRRSAIG